MKIAFYCMQFGERGTEVATYDYAHFNESILGNESIIIGTNKREMVSYEKFKSRFKTILIDEDWSPVDNSPIKHRFNKIVDKEGAGGFYIQYNGDDFGMLPDNCDTYAHCVFHMNQPHGTVYSGVSEYLAKKHNRQSFVPLMVNLSDEQSNLRDMLGIPKNAFVIGRHGGRDTFNNLGGLYSSIEESLKLRSDLYYVFVNTNEFIRHPRVIYVDKIIDQGIKRAFLNTCDAMVHSRAVGETFGLAVAEFSYLNKPVIYYSGPQTDTAHIDMLGDKGIPFNNPASYLEVSTFISEEYIRSRDWNAYAVGYNPIAVMKKFNKTFIDKQ